MNLKFAQQMNLEFRMNLKNYLENIDLHIKRLKNKYRKLILYFFDQLVKSIILFKNF